MWRRHFWWHWHVPRGQGISSGWSSGPLVVIAEQAPKAVAVSLAMPADFVSVPVHILSDQKSTALAYEETRQAVELISKVAKENGRLRMSMGVVSLSQHQGGFGISSGSWSQPAASVEIFLLVRLSTNGDNIFDAGVEAAKFVEGLKMPGKTRCELGRPPACGRKSGAISGKGVELDCGGDEENARGAVTAGRRQCSRSRGPGEGGTGR